MHVMKLAHILQYLYSSNIFQFEFELEPEPELELEFELGIMRLRTNL